VKKKSKKSKYTFDDLVAIMAQLRGPDGCPWDRKQNHQSLLPYLLEETYEVADAIRARNMSELREELGDLLLQIVFHSQLAGERDRFTITDVTDHICRKLIGRHPHVFETGERLTAELVLGNWEKIKLTEKKESGKKRGVLDGLPKALPALLRAYRLQEKTSRFGFDWDDPAPVLDKVEEEIDELRQSMRRREKKRRKQETEHELGDLLFALVNLARHLKIDPESALTRTNQRFEKRFRYIEKHLPKTGKKLGEATLAELDELWDQAKKKVG
jgi:tetrapyrrole methylase family protein/MazG family protein